MHRVTATTAAVLLRKIAPGNGRTSPEAPGSSAAASASEPGGFGHSMPMVAAYAKSAPATAPSALLHADGGGHGLSAAVQLGKTHRQVAPRGKFT